MKLNKEELLLINKLLINELNEQFNLTQDRDLEYEILLQDLKNKIMFELVDNGNS